MAKDSLQQRGGTKERIRREPLAIVHPPPNYCTWDWGRNIKQVLCVGEQREWVSEPFRGVGLKRPPQRHKSLRSHHSHLFQRFNSTAHALTKTATSGVIQCILCWHCSEPKIAAKSAISRAWVCDFLHFSSHQSGKTKAQVQIVICHCKCILQVLLSTHTLYFLR